MKTHQANLVMFINVLSEHSFSLSGMGSKNTAYEQMPTKKQVLWQERISAATPSIQKTQVTMVIVSSFT